MDKWIVYTLVVIAGLICIFSEVKIDFLNKPNKVASNNNFVVQNQTIKNNIEISNNVIENNTVVGNNIVTGNNVVVGNEIDNPIGEVEEKGSWKLSDDEETIFNEETKDVKKVGGVITNDDVLKITGGIKSNYRGTWTVLGVENGKVKLVSTENVGIKKLGYEDEEAVKAIAVVDNNNLTADERFERSVWSYRNAIDNLNQIAIRATGIEDARSIKIEDLEEVLGITEEDKVKSNTGYGKSNQYCFIGDSENGKIYSKQLSYNEENWSEWIRSNENIFVSDDKTIDGTEENKNNTIEITTNYYAYDYTEEQKNKFSSSIAKGDYWIASKCFNANVGFANYMLFEYSSMDQQIFAGGGFYSNGYSPLYTETKRC